MVNFTLTKMEEEIFRAALRWCDAPELLHAADCFKPDAQDFIHLERALTPAHPLWGFLHGMREAGSYSFETVCRNWAVNSRPYPVLSTEKRAIHVFSWEKIVPERSYCREDLLERLSEHPLCRSGKKAEELFQELFLYHPDLEIDCMAETAVVRCSPGQGLLSESFFGEEAAAAGIARSEVLQELPEKWYVHLQLPDEQLEKFCWVIRKNGSSSICESGEMATVMTQMIRRSRGEFLDHGNAPFPLEYFWQESGAFLQPARQIKFAAYLLGAMMNAEPSAIPAEFKIPDITKIYGDDL